ncbi:MAG TPA: hypothetical protein PK264_02245, partial [Hyphomicrobiaceae bacterium]|nr:hypothetical protein [Hyphomicrobiaceae bacterium]
SGALVSSPAVEWGRVRADGGTSGTAAATRRAAATAAEMGAAADTTAAGAGEATAVGPPSGWATTFALTVGVGTSPAAR